MDAAFMIQTDVASLGEADGVLRCRFQHALASAVLADTRIRLGTHSKDPAFLNWLQVRRYSVALPKSPQRMEKLQGGPYL